MRRIEAGADTVHWGYDGANANLDKVLGGSVNNAKVDKLKQALPS